MPIGVQIVGRPFKEELVLRMMIELEELHEKNSENVNGKKTNGGGNNSS